MIVLTLTDGVETAERPRQKLEARLQVLGLARVSH